MCSNLSKLQSLMCSNLSTRALGQTWASNLVIKPGHRKLGCLIGWISRALTFRNCRLSSISRICLWDSYVGKVRQGGFSQVSDTLLVFFHQCRPQPIQTTHYHQRWSKQTSVSVQVFCVSITCTCTHTHALHPTCPFPWTPPTCMHTHTQTESYIGTAMYKMLKLISEELKINSSVLLNWLVFRSEHYSLVAPSYVQNALHF